MGKFKEIFTNKRIIILIIFLVLSIILIGPSLSEGVAIRSVEKNSSASQALPHAMASPDPNLKPMNREVIQSINGIPVKTVEEYYTQINTLTENQTITIKTNKQNYFLTTKTGNLTEAQDIGINVYPRPTNNIKKGLDLEGGTRVLLQPQEEASQEDLELTVANIKQRLNVFGLSDITVRITNDLFGTNYISVEIPGVNEQEVKQLLAQQGKFEAKIGNETVFKGGNKDILYVCRTAECSGITPGSCGITNVGEYSCGFRFSISLSQEAAQKQASVTKDLAVVPSGFGQSYLSENLTLHLDDEQVDELRIGADLKGNPVTDISISGSGVGVNQKEATSASLQSMKQLQTILVTGSLPVKLEIVKTDTISPALGEGFIQNAILVGLLSILIVIIIVSVRYQEWKISIPMSITMLSEVIIILGFASLIGWRMDMVAIAAIIIAIGSGVDDQIVIADETLGKTKKDVENYSWKQKLARAFFIVMASYLTLVVAMIPLWFAGAGLLKGFALTTIAGVTIGVFVTRPAYATILEILVENKN